MKINLKAFNELVNKNFIGVQKHPDSDLLIWNYTNKAQYDGEWLPETRMARGLITDLDGNILYRSFDKFFNYAEHTGEDSKLEPIPNEEFSVYEKYDGSLGILYWIDGETFISTRGSFVSDQAKVATKILRDKYPNVPFQNLHEWTILFEIIYPENRIVVDYGEMKDLVLLNAINTETGESINYKELTKFAKENNIPIAERYQFTSLPDMNTDIPINVEGYVIEFEGGMKVKMKYDEYVRLHRLVTGVNSKTIWDLLRHKQPFDELLDKVPDEFYDWVKKTKLNLENSYKEIEDSAKKKFKEISDLKTRKEQAFSLSGYTYPGIVFKMLDGKDYEEQIWKIIKPRAEKPFKEDVDA